jgi:PAS domain S-box-containing protein
VGTSLAAEPLLALAVRVTSEQRVDSVLQSIVQGLASQPGVALARIWLLPSADLCSFCHAVSDSPDSLCLVASAGTPINSPGEDWRFLQGHFARMPFNIGKVGQVAANRHPILVEDVAAQNDWIVRPEWAKREEIRSFAGHPLIFRGKLLGVIAVFSRQSLGQQEFTWLGLFANQAALAIANACTEEALRSSENNLATIINTIPTAAWTTRPDGYCDFLNQVWLDYAGMTAEQAQGWGWAEAIHSDDRTKLVEEWQLCLASGTPVDTEARIRRFDSSYRWFLIRGNPLKDQGGNILKWYGTCVDIEDHKRGEEALRTRELSWRQIVDNIPGLVATTGAMGEVEFLNRQTLEYFGKTSEELKNWALIDAVHPDDLPRVIEARKKSIETGQVYEIEHRCRRADGVYRWFQVRGLPVRDTENKITAWYLLLTDIENRKKAEEALQSSERNLRIMINAIPTLVGVLRPDGSVLHAGEMASTYTGLNLGKMREEDARARILHPEDVERLREARREALKRPVPFENEQRVLGKDGRYRWFLFRYKPLLDEQGRIDRWYVAAFDIEDRKRAEEALQSSERDLRLMIDAIPGMIHTARPDGYLDYFNQRWLEFVGCSLSDVEGWKWTSWIHPDDLPGILDKWRTCVANGETFEYETRVRRGDGQYRWMFHRKVPLRDKRGRIVRWYGASLDIEDRKRAEAQVEQAYLRLAEAQRLSKTGSFITDLAADEHNWSEEAFRIFEFDSAAKVTVRMIRDSVHPEDLPSFDAVIARGMTGADVDFVFRVVTSRGVLKHIRGMARVIQQIAGRPLFIGALQDVTESKLAEEALNRARSELAHVTRVTTLNALTASIAHEVNQPLSGIVSNASASLRFLAGDAPNLEEAREAVRDIIRDGKRASEIITRIRTLTKRAAAPREKLDLNETISEVLALIGDEAKRNSVIVRTQFADTLSPVAGDRVQLQQVVLNLVMNAIQAMSSVTERPRELIISTRNTDADCVQATVEDSGTGIPSDTVDKIFDSFYTTKPGGMGMGLSISRSILQSHGGRLWVAGKQAPGTIFHFTVTKYHEEGAYGRAAGT